MCCFTAVVKRVVPFTIAFVAGIAGFSFIASPDFQEKKTDLRQRSVSQLNLVCSDELGAVGQLNRKDLNEEIGLLNEEMRHLYERQLEISADVNVESRRDEINSIGRKIKAAERNLAKYKLRDWILESKAGRDKLGVIKLVLEHKCIEF